MLVITTPRTLFRGVVDCPLLLLEDTAAAAEVGTGAGAGAETRIASDWFAFFLSGLSLCDCRRVSGVLESLLLLDSVEVMGDAGNEAVSPMREIEFPMPRALLAACGRDDRAAAASRLNFSCSASRPRRETCAVCNVDCRDNALC